MLNNLHKKLVALVVFGVLSCTTFPPTPIFKNTAPCTQTLAPYMQSNAFDITNINEDRLLTHVENLIRNGQTPIIITDKDGTITPRNLEIEPAHAARLVELIATGCKVIILSANSMKNVSKQLTSPLLNKILPGVNENRAKNGLPALSTEIFKNLIVCTSSGSKTWTFDDSDKSYVLTHSYVIDEKSYDVVQKTIQSIITIFQGHPMLKMSKQAVLVDTGTQLAISTIELEASQEQRNNFKFEDFEANHAFGRQKREVWNTVLREIFASFHTGNYKLIIELLKEYNTILNSSVSGTKKRAFAAVLMQEQYAPFRTTTLIDSLKIVLGVLDQKTDYLPVCKKRLASLTPDFERARRGWQRMKKGRKPDLRKLPEINKNSPTLQQDLYELMKFKERQIFYWQSLLSGLKNPDSVDRSQFSKSIEQLISIMEAYKTKSVEFKIPFVELGGTRTIDVKFCSKGDAINDLIDKFNFNPETIIYYGDEFFPNGGDTTALLSNAHFFVNVGKKVSPTQLPPVKDTFIYTDADAGPDATAEQFNRFTQMLLATPALLSNAA